MYGNNKFIKKLKGWLDIYQIFYAFEKTYPKHNNF